MEIEIKKCKIKNGMFLAYEYTQTIDGVTNNISNSSNAVIHEDLRASLDALVPHFAFLTEEINKEQMKKITQKNKEELGKVTIKYEVSGISIGGSVESEGVTIIGQKILDNGKKVNFCTPFTKWEDEYDYSTELVEKVNEVKEEVLAYMEGKQAKSNQADLFEGFEVDLDGAFENEPEAVNIVVKCK